MADGPRLRACPACGREVSIRAAACPGCGDPLTTVEGDDARHGGARVDRSFASWACPACGASHPNWERADRCPTTGQSLRGVAGAVGPATPDAPFVPRSVNNVITRLLLGCWVLIVVSVVLGMCVVPNPYVYVMGTAGFLSEPGRLASALLSLLVWSAVCWFLIWAFSSRDAK